MSERGEPCLSNGLQKEGEPLPLPEAVSALDCQPRQCRRDMASRQTAATGQGGSAVRSSHVDMNHFLQFFRRQKPCGLQRLVGLACYGPRCSLALCQPTIAASSLSQRAFCTRPALDTRFAVIKDSEWGKNCPGMRLCGQTWVLSL